MPDSWIYADFADNVEWLREKHRKELSEIPSGTLSALAEYYLKKRLFVLNEKPVKLDRRLGRPTPYLAFWFADAFGLKDKQKVNQFALTLSYSSIICSIRDDLVDGRVKLNGELASEHAHVSLSNFFCDRYLKIFKNIFPPDSTIWYVLSESLNEYGLYEYWNFLNNKENRFDPLSAQFLKRSSQYMKVVFLPTIAAISLLTGDESKINRIKSFLTNYFMGVRIADDLRDWQRDLKTPNYNCSTVIHHALRCGNRREIGLDGMRSMFFSKVFVTSLYEALLISYMTAKRNASLFHSRYLDEFMNSQLEYYKAERDYLINHSSIIGSSLQNFLESKGIINYKAKAVA